MVEAADGYLAEIGIINMVAAILDVLEKVGRQIVAIHGLNGLVSIK